MVVRGEVARLAGRTPSAALLPVLLVLLGGAATSATAVENALPAQPPSSALPRLWEEIANVKSMMAIISDELNRFNTLYLGKLEHRMLAIATALSSVDSNVKNLQERAHVWDTFQLHVAAWNEQIKTLDKKVDILSRGHDKLDLMDGKLASLLSLDYKVERVAGKIEETDNKLSALGRSVENNRESASLFGDVATRGVVSTLRIIERKLDRVHAAMAGLKHEGGGGGGGGGGGRGKGGGRGGGGGGSHRSSSSSVDEESGSPGSASVSALGRGKLVIRCNAPVALEELLRDVAAKVDVMFDKMASAEADTAEPPPRFLHQFHHVSELRELTENKMLERLWKRLTSPFKRTARAVEGLQAAVQASSNASAAAAAEACAASCAAFAAAAERRLDACADASASASAAAARRLEQRLDRTADAAAAEARRLDARLEEIGAVCAEGVRGTSHGSNRSVEGTFHSTDGCGSSPTEPSDPVSPHPYPKDIPRVPEYDSSDEYSGSSGDGELGGSDVEPPFIPVIEKTFARNCEDLFGATRIRHNGIYKLGGHETNSNGRDFYTRFCDMQTNGGGWTVIQRRGNFHGPRQNFSLPWNEYRAGFGDLDKEFWFGNDFIHRLTYQKDMILRVELESFSGKKVWAEYSSFRVGPVESNYRITVGGYTGNATNSLVAHDGALFSTIDKTNDAAPSCCPCAPSYGGGWWFDSCFEANLNGVYYTPRDKREEFRGIIWEHWLGDESLKSTEMKIRPKVMPVIAGKEDPSFEEHSTSMDDVNPLDIPEDP